MRSSSGAAASLREDLVLGLDDEGEELLCEQAVAGSEGSPRRGRIRQPAWARGEAMTPDEIVAFAMSR